MSSQGAVSNGTSSKIRTDLLDRGTESDGMIVLPGSCDMAHPSSSNAALRLALLNVEEFEGALSQQSHPATIKKRQPGTTSFRSPRTAKSSSGRLAKASPGLASQMKPCGQISEVTGSLKSMESEASDQTSFPRLDKSASKTDALPIPGGMSDHKAGITGEASGKLSEEPSCSPFGDPDFQRSSFGSLSGASEEASEALLTKLSINPTLLSDLKAMPSATLSAYMLAAEETRAITFGAMDTGRKRALDGATADEGSIKNAMQMLETTVPHSAIQSLQGYEDYGLSEVAAALTRSTGA